MNKSLKFRLIFINIFCFVLISSCSGQKTIFKDKKITLIQEPKYIKWVTGKEFDSWTPTQMEFDKIDKLLIEAINDNQFYFLKTKNISEIRKNYRQYLCYTNEKGEKIVYINSMCELFNDYDKDNNPVPFDWKNKMIDISDGGECFWNIKINLDTNKYYELKINGRS